MVGGILLANAGSYIWFPVLVATLGGTDSGFWAGVVMCMTYVGRLLATFCYEGVAARAGGRGGVFLGTALEAVALGLMGFADGVLVYSVLAFFIGFGSGTSFPGLKNVLVSFPEEERPKAFSAFQMAGQVGLFGGALLGAVLTDVDLRTLFCVVFAPLPRLLPDHHRSHPQDPVRQGSGGRARPRPSDQPDRVQGHRGARRHPLLPAVCRLLVPVARLRGRHPLHMAQYAPQWAPSAPFWITGLSILVLQYPLFELFDDKFGPGTVLAVWNARCTRAVRSARRGRGQTGRRERRRPGRRRRSGCGERRTGEQRCRRRTPHTARTVGEWGMCACGRAVVSGGSDRSGTRGLPGGRCGGSPCPGSSPPTSRSRRR
ncbi:hypothetical protein GCM10009601_49720 [Streptomyces thermospinosisporus]|uniref:MFS transporter n=1 Tax=Streptomyces thermospinosisporus TaxID=161482 RepID=A0ABN1Z4I0_9ACTN